MQHNYKFDWDKKREELIEKTNNSSKEMQKYVLNEKNRKITSSYINEIFRNYDIDYTVNDISIFNIAMTHPSYIDKDYRDIKNLKPILMGINFLNGEDIIPISEKKKNMAIPLGDISYERLEFLGDAIIRYIISHYLFLRFDKMDEGDLTKLRTRLENKLTLAELTRCIGLHKYVLLPRNLEASSAREKNYKFQCDIFEAFIAALFFDIQGIKYSDIGKRIDIFNITGGTAYEVCFKFITSLIEQEIDLTELLDTEKNYKDELLQEYHKLGWSDPKYGMIETITDTSRMGKKYFKMYVRDGNGEVIGIGVGSSKQTGEKMAAKKALEHLQVIDDENKDICVEVSCINIKT